MALVVVRAISYLRRLLRGTQGPITGTKYWEKRAEKHGRLSVLHLGHTEREYESVTKWQKQILFPLLRQQLSGSERTILDFGCGPGRFTGDLAALIAGEAVGVDPVAPFLEMAPSHDNVRYVQCEEGTIPLQACSVDAIWICLVLGGVTVTQTLTRTVYELNRVLRDGGLLFLVENTSRKPNGLNWHFRTQEEYCAMFQEINLRPIGLYEDLGESISVMAGRKATSVNRPSPR